MAPLRQSYYSFLRLLRRRHLPGFAKKVPGRYVGRRGRRTGTRPGLRRVAMQCRFSAVPLKYFEFQMTLDCFSYLWPVIGHKTRWAFRPLHKNARPVRRSRESIDRSIHILELQSSRSFQNSMHRSSSLKRDVPSQRSSRIGGFPEGQLREHRTGLPYVPSTPSTRSSSSRSGGGSVPSPKDREDPYRPQLSGAPSLGRQKILSHRSPLRQAGSPMRQQASPPSKMMMHPSAQKEASLDPHRPRTSPGWQGAPHDYEEEEERVLRRPSPLRRIPSARRNARVGEPLDRHSAAGSGRSNHNSSNHSQSRSARARRSPAKQPSFATTASLSSASSASQQQRQQLLRPNMATSDASSFRVDASSFRTASTLSGGGSSRYLDRHSRNSRRTTTHSVPEEAYVREEEEEEEYDDAASFNEEYEEDEAHYYTHPHYEKEEENEDPFLMMNASFVSIDFGSTVGVAPPMPPMLSQKPSAQQQRRGGGYHHEEAEYDDNRW